MRRSTRTSRSSGLTCQTVPRVNKGEEAFGFWCRALRLPSPQRNYRFHPKRRFEIDYAWPEYRIGIEIQGGIFIPAGGAHSRPMNIIRDMTKHNLLLDAGWRVWHYTPKEAIDGIAVQHIDKVLRAADTTIALKLTKEAVIPPCREQIDDAQKSMDLEGRRSAAIPF